MMTEAADSGIHAHGAVVCSTCGRSRHPFEMAVSAAVREPIVAEIRRKHPAWSATEPICSDCLNRFRAEYVRHLLEAEKGELSELEKEVIRSLRDDDAISANVNEKFDRELTLSERISDHMADFGGSWTFLLLFAAGLIGWMVLNTVVLISRPFDPFPFILLNLILSCLAAVQAPIILMSQNRQDARDRLRSEYDYRVNLKAELEIRLLHAKMDQLLTHQWQRLLEIQELQMDLMEEVAARRSGDDDGDSQPEANA